MSTANYSQLKQLATDWVIRHKTSDGLSLYDSNFTIHAQGAICWMAEFAAAQQQLIEASAAALAEPSEMVIVDPSSARGQQMLRNAAFERPVTQGDPPPSDAQSAPTAALVERAKPDETRCKSCGCQDWEHAQSIVASAWGTVSQACVCGSCTAFVAEPPAVADRASAPAPLERLEQLKQIVQMALVEAMQEIILQSVNDAGCCAICGNDIINHDQSCGVHLGMVALNQSAALRGVGTQDKEPK